MFFSCGHTPKQTQTVTLKCDDCAAFWPQATASYTHIQTPLADQRLPGQPTNTASH